MSDVDKAVEAIIEHKAEKIKNKLRKSYIQSVLKKLNVITDKTRHQEVEVLAKAFKVGAVDAMIYDVGAALDLSVWKKPDERKRMLKKIFPKK